MAASTSQHALSSIKLWSNSSFSLEKRTCHVHSVSVGRRCPSARQLGLVCASNSQSSVVEPVQLPRSPKSGTSPKKSSESALILIRHGESLWNEKNLFTGCVDVPLTPKGVEEAIEAGKRICNIPVDVIYTSSLIRAQMTAMLAMMQHRRKKVPIIVHNESEQAHKWSQIYSEETKKQSIPVITAWQLNERMYGELQGLNKQETADRFGKEQVHEWRRSYDIPPPNGESLEMCAERAVAYFKDQIIPQLVAGKHVMIAAHGNSLRSIIMHLDKLTSQEVISLELSTGIPMLYIFKEGKFIRRGSPAGPSEAGVYAYTKAPPHNSLAATRFDPPHLPHHSTFPSALAGKKKPKGNNRLPDEGPAASFTVSCMSNHNAPRDIPKPASVDEFLVKNGKKKKASAMNPFLPCAAGESFMSGLFRKKGRSADKRLLSRRDRDVVFDLEGKSGDAIELLDASPAAVRKSFSDRHCATRIENLSLSCLNSPRAPNVDTREYRVFVGTWNVGGKPPDSSVNLEEFLQIEGLPDIYAQDGQTSGDELSPPESTSSQQSNRHGGRDTTSAIPKSASGGLLFPAKPSFKVVNKSYRVDNALVKTCTCMSDPSTMQRRAREMREFLYRVEAAAASPGRGAEDDGALPIEGGDQRGGGTNYCLIARKQMVGIFLSVWVRRELVQYVGHLRVDCVGRGIMGRLGNKVVDLRLLVLAQA
ncbi:hypothetical protein C2845_PM11G25450 [Panicum miliaceum]|uniref:phosphoglycerate mutase (2,3-diphosphoglycerate-dependent) n=1 Tax=Panicum miliaceum TaxID=4540 RepID=A0A3L6RPJ6_PANMI|nr:hypothetical protein C2845_PM11G25450 [Panicum miliaceum]